MKDTMTVFSYTFLEHVKKKGFKISTVIVLVLTVVLMLLPSIIQTLSTGQGSTPSKPVENAGVVYIVDKAKLLGDDYSSLSRRFPGYQFLRGSGDTEALKNTVKNEKNKYLIVIGEDTSTFGAKYYYKEYFVGPSPGEVKDTLKKLYDNNVLVNENVKQESIEKISAPIQFAEEGLGINYVERQISCIVILLLLFFAIYYYGYWVAISVASEKTSRVMEVLITSTKPQNIIVGKTLAMGLLGVMQLTLVILTGLVTNKIAYPEGGATVMGQTISFSSFSPFSILMLVVYFVLGYGLYAMMDAVAGASVSRSEDVNSALMPISLIAVISFYVSYMASVIPGGGRITAIASIVPFTAPFAMPGRMIAMEVPLWEIGLSLVLLIVTIVFFVKISVRFYSSAVLHYGKRLKLTELAKMSKNK